MSVAKQNQNQAAAAAAAARDLKQKVLTCLHKLSDKDTHGAAALELENIAKTLSTSTLSSFLSSIIATDSTDKSAVRKQCLNLISLLAFHHGNALSLHLSKLLSAILRRLCDSDSSIRAACVSASASIASNVTKVSFSSLCKPYLEALFTEQHVNSQIGTAMCLSAIIEAVAEPDLVLLRKLLGRFEKMVKCAGFKAKAAVLGLIGSVIEVGVAAGSVQIVSNLLTCLLDLLSSEDWAARKAAAEALVKLAVVEKETLQEFKTACLKTFEAKRFDKVKVVRETMNQMVEVWKEIPDVSDEVPANLESHSSTKENASDGRCPPGSKTSCSITSGAPQLRKKLLSKKSPSCNGSSVTTARKRSPLNYSEKKTGPAMFRKLDHKKPSELKVEISIPCGPGKAISEDNPADRDDRIMDKGEERNRLAKREAKRTLFNKSGSRVVPCHQEISESTVGVSSETGNILRNQKECEDLSLIRKQLVQIENRQSNLLDLLQKLIGSSESGMQSLETRVHGLELAVDEISFDLAVSTGRISSTSSAGGLCCKLPGAEFLSAKLWKRRESRCATSLIITSCGTTRAVSMHNPANTSGDSEAFKLENRRSQFQGGCGIIMNPLAKIPSDSGNFRTSLK